MIEQYVNITDGKIVQRSSLAKQIAALPTGRYLVKIERKNKRTNNQNAYIHAVLFPELANALIDAGYEGITSDIAKEVAKDRFLKVNRVNKDTGEIIEYVRKTSELTTTEMNEFIDSVIRFAAESLNYEIPFPNEQVKMFAND